MCPSNVQDRNSGRLKYSKSCAFNHSFFLWFLWISEKSSIVSINSTSWFVFITYTELVKRRAKWIFFRSQFNPNSKYFVLWPSWFVANIWPSKNGPESRSEYLVFVVGILSVGNVPFRVILFYRVRIVLLILYNHFNAVLFISYHQIMKASRPSTNNSLSVIKGIEH
jgi:hypothetical protein